MKIYINPKIGELSNCFHKGICLYISQYSGSDSYAYEKNKLILYEDNEYQIHFNYYDEIKSFDIL